MQNVATDGVSTATRDRNVSRIVVLRHASGVKYVYDNLRLTERTVAYVLPLPCRDGSINIIVLDAVARRCMKAVAAPPTFDVSPGIILRALPDRSESDLCTASPPASPIRGP